MPKKATASFSGFPNETLKFLRGIRRNNSKDWFESHRKDYDQFFVEPAKDFVNAFAAQRSKLSRDLVAEPRINGSIFRINRDIRFTKDKKPYKDHLDFVFWEGEKKASSSSLFFRVSPDGTYVGAGFHQGCPAHQKALRKAVAEASSGKALARVAKKLRSTGYTIEGKHYKRMPSGVPHDGPAAEFLLHNALYAVDVDKPAVACQSDIMEHCVTRWKALMPLHRWLLAHVR